jgi:mono/diheme cytochrome c family protein
MGKKLGVKDLSRSTLDEATLREVIGRGLPDRQMPGYGDRITREELDALVAYVMGLAR